MGAFPTPSVFDPKAHCWVHAANVAAIAAPNGTWANDFAVVNAIKAALNAMLAAAKESGLMVQD